MSLNNIQPAGGGISERYNSYSDNLEPGCLTGG